MPLYEGSIFVPNAPDFIALTDYSRSEEMWDFKRRDAEALLQLLRDETIVNTAWDVTTRRAWADSIHECSQTLIYALQANDDGEFKMRLQHFFSCKRRHCPICDWRRALRRQACSLGTLAEAMQAYPTARFILLTLTVQNCPVTQLRPTIGEMSAGWGRLLKRKEFRSVLGWIRKVEVTQEEKRPDYAHPHYHALLMVPALYFKTDKYVKQADWLKAWRGAMRDEGITQVDIRAVKKIRKRDDLGDLADLTDAPAREALMDGLREVLKSAGYSLKPSELRYTRETADWLFEYFRQVDKLRFVAAGGVLKDAFKQCEAEEASASEDLVHVTGDSEAAEGLPRVAFHWNLERWRYGRKRNQ